jgi:uncharacterized protein
MRDGARGGDIPARLVVAEAVARSLRLAGELPLAQLPRLRSALAASEGALRVQARFSADPESLGRLQGELAGELQLTCQRCLRPTAWALDGHFDLSLVGSEAEEARLLESREPVLVAEGQLPLWDVLEDEALLALPLAPVCAESGCVGAAGETSARQMGDNDRPGDSRPNPFLALKGKFPAR